MVVVSVILWHCSIFTVLILQTLFVPTWQANITWDSSSEKWLAFYFRYCGLTCKNAATQEIKALTCQEPACFQCDCEPSCSMYGTCCPDLNSTTDVDHTGMNSLEASGKSHPDNVPSADRFVCDTFPGITEHYYMISDCLPEYIRLAEQDRSAGNGSRISTSMTEDAQTVWDVQAQCVDSNTDTFDALTPYLDLRQGITFKNKFCAICNGYHIVDNSSGHSLNTSQPGEENLAAAWTVDASCYHFQNLYQATTEVELFHLAVGRGQYECRIEYKQPYALVRAKRCDPEMNRVNDSECSRSGSSLQDYCLNLTQKYLRVQGGQNMFCYLCNGGLLSTYSCLPGGSVLSNSTTDMKYHHSAMPLSLDTANRKQNSNFSDVLDCTAEEIAQGVCEPAVCTAGKLVDTGGWCRSPLEQIRGLGYKMFLVLVPEVLNICVSETDVRLVHDRIYDRLSNLSQEVQLETKVTVLLGSHERLEFIQKVSIMAHFIGSRNHSRDTFERELLNLTSREWEIDLSNGNNSTLVLTPTALGTELSAVIDAAMNDVVKDNISVAPVFLEFPVVTTGETIDDPCDLLSTMTPINYTFPAVKQYRMFTELGQSASGQWDFRDQFIDVTHSLTCPFVVVNVTDTWFNGNGLVFSFTFEDKGYAVQSMSKISLVRGELRICKSLFTYLKRDRLGVLRKVLYYVYYLDIAILILSIVCLLMSFITYCLFPTLRTLPGLNNMSLCITSAIAEILFLITFVFGIDGTLPRVYCLFHAIALRYFWLASVFWMNACCIHMYRVFKSRGTRFINSNSDKKYYLQYCLFAYGTPMVFVALMVAISVWKSSDTIEVMGVICVLIFYFPELSVLVYFIDPVLYATLINGILFVLTVREIVLVSCLQERKRIGQSVITYAKLSTLTGVFYIITIIASIVEYFIIFILISFGFVFLQGVFFFVSFTFNKRVGKLYCNLLSRVRESCRGGDGNRRPGHRSDFLLDLKMARQQQRIELPERSH